MDRKEYLKEWNKQNKDKVNAYKRASYAKKPDVYKKHVKNWREQNPYRAIQTDLCYGAKTRAATQGVPFDLVPDDIVIPEYCPVLTGLKLTRNKGGSSNESSPTLDKIIPSLGYVKGNIVVVSQRANVVKGNSTYEELKSWVDWMAARR